MTWMTLKKAPGKNPGAFFIWYDLKLNFGCAGSFLFLLGKSEGREFFLFAPAEEDNGSGDGRNGEPEWDSGNDADRKA